ncbi:hypothetical protein BKH46_02385 [Helicobacter sp. 12S02634-8]|uniref:alpha/beta hydrolase n=1 Tax=Helicobacter sp. 12S02634-8 TaxID=1476199 RepID=UPI000BCD8E6D|nr:alpha/beta hydrolase-fold protein [Helicobacter sp. 12S02634-8]PAF48175.1 hypothetical protein BKH46_02385 [Helicobacter sp. 12S02634-8]
MQMILFVLLGLLSLWLEAKPNQDIPPIKKEVYTHFKLKNFTLSSAQGRKYKIFLAIPSTPPPKEGYSVLYMLDGNKQFPMLLNLYTPISSPPLIVAIGYLGHLGYDIPARTHDYTPKAKGKQYAQGGGAEEFYHFIENKLKPTITSHYPINTNKQALFGHSFGGLFVLYTLFTHPKAFNDYIAASPSLWWGDGVIIPTHKPFIKSLPHSLTITLGELENKPSKAPFNAYTLTQELRKQGVNAAFISFPHQTHGSSIAAALKTALKVIASP